MVSCDEFEHEAAEKPFGRSALGHERWHAGLVCFVSLVGHYLAVYRELAQLPIQLFFLLVVDTVLPDDIAFIRIQTCQLSFHTFASHIALQLSVGRYVRRLIRLS